MLGGGVSSFSYMDPAECRLLVAVLYISSMTATIKKTKKKKEKEALSVKLKTEMAGLNSCC